MIEPCRLAPTLDDISTTLPQQEHPSRLDHTSRHGAMLYVIETRRPSAYLDLLDDRQLDDKLLADHAPGRNWTHRGWTTAVDMV